MPFFFTQVRAALPYVRETRSRAAIACTSQSYLSDNPSFQFQCSSLKAAERLRTSSIVCSMRALKNFRKVIMFFSLLSASTISWSKSSSWVSGMMFLKGQFGASHSPHFRRVDSFSSKSSVTNRSINLYTSCETNVVSPHSHFR